MGLYDILVSLYHFNLQTVIVIENRFFHVLRSFIPFLHLYPVMPIQAGSPLDLKGSFVLIFGHGTNCKNGQEVLNPT